MKIRHVVLVLALFLSGISYVSAQGGEEFKVVSDLYTSEDIYTLVVIRNSPEWEEDRVNSFVSNNYPYGATRGYIQRERIIDLLFNPLSPERYDHNQVVLIRETEGWVFAYQLNSNREVEQVVIELSAEAIINLEGDSPWNWSRECGFVPTFLEAGMTYPHFIVAFTTFQGDVGWLLVGAQPPDAGYYTLSYGTSTPERRYCTENKPVIEVTEDMRYLMFFDTLEVGEDGHPHPVGVFTTTTENETYLNLIEALERLYSD